MQPGVPVSTRMLLRRTTLFLSLLAAACSDPTGPCDGEHACQVSGVDLAVVDVRIVAGNRLGTDAVSGLPIYDAGPITAAVTIVNRGDSVFPGQQSTALGDLPSLRPGETHELTLLADFTERIMHLEAGGDPRMADVVRISGSFSLLEADADPGNDFAFSPSIHVAAPVVELSLSLGQRTEIRANEPFVASFTVRNRSMHNAVLDSSDVVLCMVDFDLGCWGSWPYFGKFDLPAVGAGSHHENAYAATAPPEATIWQDEAHEAWLAMCIVPSDLGAYVDFTSPCGGGLTITVRPSYTACSPPLLQLGVEAALPEANCGFRPGATAGEFSVFALDAVAGTTYVAASTGPLQVYDADGERADLPGDGISFARDGRYYLVLYHFGDVSVTVTAVATAGMPTS